MVPGRKPKSIEQRELEGNAGKRALPPAVRTEPGSFEAPEGMPAEGLELWEEVVGRLRRAGVVDQVDRSALVAMCMQWARAVRLGQVIAHEGYFTMGSMGQLVEHPAIGMERQAHALFLRFAEQYALTPAARARVAAAVQGRGGGQAELDAIIGADPTPLA